RGLVEAALPQELPSHHRVGRVERIGVELLGDLVRLDEASTLGTARAVRPSVALLAAQGDPDLVGEPLDGLAEAEPVDLHQEPEDVAALAAAEAVDESSGRVDVERRGLLVVERAQTLQ